MKLHREHAFKEHALASVQLATARPTHCVGCLSRWLSLCLSVSVSLRMAWLNCTSASVCVCLYLSVVCVVVFRPLSVRLSVSICVYLTHCLLLALSQRNYTVPCVSVCARACVTSCFPICVCVGAFPVVLKFCVSLGNFLAP